MSGGAVLSSLPPEHTFVFGKDQATARALLDAARQLGLDTGVVLTADNGFVVPTAVWDQCAAAHRSVDF